MWFNVFCVLDWQNGYLKGAYALVNEFMIQVEWKLYDKQLSKTDCQSPIGSWLLQNNNRHARTFMPMAKRALVLSLLARFEKLQFMSQS